MKAKFYNYIYLDASRPGMFTYPGLYLSFLYEPYYVGKGTKDRYKIHLTYDYFKKSESFKYRIFKVCVDGKDPADYIMKLNRTNSEDLAYSTEEFLIRKIGRQHDGGPLVNKMFKPSNNHQSDFMKEFNPMFKISSERHSRNVKEKQWSGDKGDSRRKIAAIRFKANSPSRKKWLVIDNTGVRYYINSNLHTWTKSRDISIHVLRSWVNKGPIHRTSIKDTSFFTHLGKRKLLGWSIFDINKLKYKESK